jgi:hypothetical protein
MADDVVDVIKAQHREVDRLLEEAMSEGSDRAALLRQVSDLLTPHSEAEESFVYPAIAERAPKQEGEEVHDSLAEHHHIEQLLQELLTGDPEEPGFDGKLAEQASDEDRAAMGARFAEQTGWSKGTGAAAAERASGSGGEKSQGSDLTRDELYEKAKEQDVPGRSSMTKAELEQAVEE